MIFSAVCKKKKHLQCFCLAYVGKWQSVWKQPKHWRQWVRSPPACWQTPHSSFMLSSSPPEHWTQRWTLKWIQGFHTQKEKSSNDDITWFLGTFVRTVAADRDAEESEEKKETSARELLVLVFVCSDLAGRSCRTWWAKLFGGFGGANTRYHFSKHVDLLTSWGFSLFTVLPWHQPHCQGPLNGYRNESNFEDFSSLSPKKVTN